MVATLPAFSAVSRSRDTIVFALFKKQKHFNL